MPPARFQILCAVIALSLGVAFASARDFPDQVEMPPLPEAMITYCFECHDSLSSEADLDLEAFESDPLAPVVAARTLDDLIHSIESREMPPRKAEAHPSDEERTAMISWLRERFRHLAGIYEDDPGHVLMPRLAKHEYRNVIRDLSGGVVTSAGRLMPNEGGAGEGFANVGEAQGMTSAVFEKYLEAARDVLRHLRVSPEQGLAWSEYPREPVPTPASARKEASDEIIAWFIAQQQKWGEEHRNELNEKFGFIHAAYLEAAWKFRHRNKLGRAGEKLESFAEIDGMALSPVALRKWNAILTSENTDSPLASWAAAWRKLPAPDRINESELREACIAIEQGKSGALAPKTEDYAPPYEISFHEAKEEVLEAAEEDGYWPFRIDIGEAKELFLVMTDAGDGNRGEFGIWRKGRFVFRDGSAKPWEEAITLVGANSGREYPFGIDGQGAKNLPAHAIGVQPPGALKFSVPEEAIVFEVELTLDENRNDRASIQALVLKEKPRSQSYIPGRFVFGGKKREAGDQELSKELARLLRRRNVSEANRTKIGLNAERNVFADWTETEQALIGGPWPDQDADVEDARAPYHYTVSQVLENATDSDLEEWERRESHLRSLFQESHQQLRARLTEVSPRDAEAKPWHREGVLPPQDLIEETKTGNLLGKIREEEKTFEERLTPILEAFARRAWRRPLSQSERESLLTLYRNARADGFSYDSAAKGPLLLVLTSPHFLYHGSHEANSPSPSANEADPITPLSSLDLASRLSFFLWASLPDEELLHLAESGELSRSDVLRSQARRMLSDPRARSLATDFGGQLWGFDGFESYTGPDEERFPEFTPELRSAMLGEVTAFLEAVFMEDRPLISLLESDTTFVNRPLARHYELATDITEDSFVEVPVGEQRGGLASMGLFLTQMSLPLRTSPVQRGNWVLEKLLGRELPPPPADVPPLSEDDRNEAGQNIREQLELHREKADCASCHDKIDPLGIALEGYDAIGRWRTEYRDGSPLADSATMHDGAHLDGAAGLRHYLLTQQEEFFEHFQRKLLGYALGRAVSVGDDRLLREMDEKFTGNGHRLSTLVETIVTSPQFTQRRSR